MNRKEKDEWLIRLNQIRCEVSKAKKRLQVAEECIYSYLKELG